MCLIVDANCAHKLLDRTKGTVGRAILEKLESGELKMATGGKNLVELSASSRNFPVLLNEFRRSGWVMIYSEGKIVAKTQEIERSDFLKSNDSHNLALAVISGAHVLFSNDNDFISDFRNAKIVPTRRTCHKTILRDDRCAPRVAPLGCCGCQPV